MSGFGPETYGDPCGGCGFSWQLSADAAVELVAALPGRYSARLHGASGGERIVDLAWTPAAYVAHVSDNLRTWSERLVSARAEPDRVVVGYDPDELAAARHYDYESLAAALWSLGWAADAWVEVVRISLSEQVVLTHAEGGTMTAAEVARVTAHDAFHHLADVDLILSGQT